MKLNDRSERALKGVHPDLIKVVRRAAAITKQDFIITEGLRTLARQQQLFAAGASKTLRSRHLTGHAVDVAILVGGKVRWDWPLYMDFSKTMKQAAKDVGVPITWGGDWKSFRDGPHYELTRSKYP
jgi:peptidoglycan L-alanyl-D-glutamate endopeptidase CwlK